MTRDKIIAFALGPIATATLSLITIPVIAWTFSPEDVGRLNVFAVATGLLALILQLGLDQAYIREYHETPHRAPLLRACLLPGTSLFTIIVLLTLPFSAEVAFLLYGVQEGSWYFITTVFSFMAFLARTLSLVVRMQERGLTYSGSQVLPKLSLLIALAMFVAFGWASDFAALLTAQIISIAVALLFLALSSLEDWILALRARVSSKEVKQLISFGFPLVGVGIAYWGLTATSTVALRSLSSLAELGIYSMSVSVSGVAAVFQLIFATVWMPTVYKWVAAGADMARIDQVREHVLAGTCAVIAVTGVLSWTIDLVLPSEFSGVKYLIIASMLQPMLYTLSETTVVGINIMRRTELALVATLIALFANVFMSWLLVPPFGAAGAATANAIAFFVFLVGRTEAASLVWKPIHCTKMYSLAAALVIFSALTALFGAEFPVHYSWAWAFAGAIIAVVFRKSYRALVLAIWNCVARRRMSLG